MEFQERRLAQIVRDFIDAYVLVGEVGLGLRAGSLDFARVESLVGSGEESVLFRLKEDCHALFRCDQDSPLSELAAGELFDLAAGALFHEAMKFREGFYLTCNYGPRLERMRAAGTMAGPLLAAFSSLIDSGRRRVDESAAELQSLLHETREQLLIVLRQIGSSGAVARVLVEDPARSEQVFGSSLGELLAYVYGAAESAYERAIADLLDNGHFEEARALLSRPELRDFVACLQAQPYAAGMASYYAGRFADTVAQLERWRCECRAHAQLATRVLGTLAIDLEPSEPDLAARARVVAARLSV